MAAKREREAAAAAASASSREKDEELRRPLPPGESAGAHSSARGAAAPSGCFVVSSEVDGLWARALEHGGGAKAARLYEPFGRITRLQGVDGKGDVWSHALGRYVLVPIAAVAESAADYAAAVLHVHSNASVWEELSRNGARFARSGGGGKGVCPAGLADDWLGFWDKLQTGCCTGTF